MTRRAVAAGAVAMTGGCAANFLSAKDGQVQMVDPNNTTIGQPVVGPRYHVAQAERVMTELGLDGLVLGQGVNVYHLTGHWPLLSRMGYPQGTLVILARRQPDKPILVLSSFNYYFQLADIHDREDFPVYIYTAPAEETAMGDEPKAAPPLIFTDRNEIPLDAIESRRLSLIETAVGEQEARANIGFALRKALNDAGLSKGVIATDSGPLSAMVENVAPASQTRPADVCMSRMRPVKSEVEIELMRQAAQANAEAALAAIKQVEPGMSYRQLRAEFFAQTARRGNVGTFMVVDRIVSDQYDDEFRDGQAFLIDAVSTFDGYHGDYGRTVFIGEPSRAIGEATRAIGLAWDEVREAMKPGLRFSEIRQLGQNAIRRLGVNYAVPFNPHSVGLFHTDHLSADPTGAFADDPILEKGMIISVDCPLMESGIGGSAHLEDLILITDQGGEAINRTDQQVIQL